MTITTKMGDKGKSLWQGKMVDKDGVEMEALGSLDELMAVLALVDLQVKGSAKTIEKVYNDIYLISGWISGYGKKIDLKKEAAMMEIDIKKMEAEMEEVSEFLYPGKKLKGWFNLARTAARKAERRLWALNKVEQIDHSILIYINRLSDYLFMLGRYPEEK